MNTIYLGKKREMFWDSYLVDNSKTNAFPRLIEPTQKEPCFLFDQGDEMRTISYPCIVKDDKGYKMYYMPWYDNCAKVYLAVVESKDGVHWTRPNLNIFDHPELEFNNVVIDHLPDGCFVFYDTNPACPAEEKYKAIGMMRLPNEEGKLKRALWCLVSPDGYHFTRSHILTKAGYFDSLNTTHWANGRYVCYFRNFHNIKDVPWPDGIDDINRPGAYKNLNEAIRDIRVMYSEDFKTWTEPKRISFYDGKDYPLYTNNIIPYERASHILVGFPTRYCERKEWTPNNDQIGSRAVKIDSMENQEKRSGLAVTDCIFMNSRDGENWNRFNEAFMTPGYEHEHNWVYGDCYPSYGFVDSGKDTYYMYTIDWHRSFGYPKPMNCYEIRKDGFACYMADGEERVLVTKPLIFEGKYLHLNFKTSAYGYIYIDILDENGNPLSEKESFEIFGDTIDRTICFADGSDFSAYANKPIRLRFRMRDAKIFSLKFE